MFGYPGAGRATPAARLARDFNLQIISTGELLHEEVNGKGILARSAKYLLRGIIR
ncbi:MAG: nucleoside monophosphate kinase [Bacteroidales bacterium]|nr:nucleoside monophosphate kinase [Bacteroidales bacterium]